MALVLYGCTILGMFLPLLSFQSKICTKYGKHWWYSFLHTTTLMLVYHCHKPVFTPKIAIFRRAGMREGGLPLPLTFQYLIFMIWRPSDLNLVMISSLASKCQHFKLRGLQFHSIKWLKNRHPNFKVLAFWSQLRYHDQIQIIRSSYQKNQILKS